MMTSPASPTPPGTRASIGAWELGVAIAATLVATALHLTVRFSAGALWRDEVVSLRNATLPTIGDIWQHLQCDSFPMVWPLVLRAWAWLGSAQSDGWLRNLGLLIGLGLLAALWLNARMLVHGVPTIALALLAFNGAVIIHGDSLRGYGLGMLAALLAFGCIWRVCESSGPRWIALALVTSLVAVHTLFHASVLILAACAGGAAVCARYRRWRRAVVILAIGALCALSILPYSLTLASSRDWIMTVRYDIDLAWIWTKFRQANSSSGHQARWLWVVASGAALIVAARAQSPRNSARMSARERDVALYCGTALATGIVAYVAFLRLLRYRMNPWYFLALMALVAACCDGCLGTLRGSVKARRWLTGVLAIVVLLTCYPLWRAATQRKTSIDRVAAYIERTANPNDLVVVNPWIYGHTLERYFNGPCPWTTLPPIEIPHLPGDLGLLKLVRQMQNPHAVEPVLEAMTRTQRSGHRVWWVGRLSIPPPGQPVADVAPAPDGPLGWNEGKYHELWGLQAGAFIDAHAVRLEPVIVDGSGRVSRYEDVALTLIEGWK